MNTIRKVATTAFCISLVISMVIATNGIAFAEEVSKDASSVLIEDNGGTPKPLTTPKIRQHYVAEGRYLTLSWSKVKKAKEYKIYRRIYGDTEWEEIAVLPSDVTLYESKTRMAEGKYCFKIKAVSPDKKKYSSSSSKYAVVYYLGKTECKAANKYGRIKVTWEPVENAKGYNVYRKKKSSGSWIFKTKISGNLSTTFYDDDNGNGKYYYTVEAVKGTDEDLDINTGAKAARAETYKSKSPSYVINSDLDSNGKIITWEPVENAAKYELEYGDNRLFIKSKRIVLSSDTTSYETGEISKSQSFFSRVRSYRVVNGIRYYSRWKNCETAASRGYTTYTRFEYKNGPFELRKRFGQKMYEYDTVQGGCTDGEYAYYLMNNRNDDKCKLVKFRISDQTVVDISAKLSVNHGNDITYNAKTDTLVIANNSGYPFRLTKVDPQSLEIIDTLEVDIPQHLNGASERTARGITGICAITYNRTQDVYVIVPKGKIGFLVLDSDFIVKEFIPLKTRINGYIWQSLDCTDKYIMVGQSPMGGSAYNQIAVYDWQGRIACNIRVLKNMELESLYHIGKRMYTTYYYPNSKSSEYQRDNYIYTFKLDAERTWVKQAVSLPTTPYKMTLTPGIASMTLKWDRATYGTGYKIYRAESPDGKFRRIKTINDINQTTYKDSKLKQKKTYYYKVKTYKTSYDKTYNSRYTKVYSAKTKAKPKPKPKQKSKKISLFNFAALI